MMGIKKQQKECTVMNIKMARNMGYMLIGMVGALSFSAAQAVDFGAFGDVNYRGFASANRDRDHRLSNTFAQGQFDLYGTQKIDPDTKAFFELVFEDGGEGYGVDLERLYISRNLSSNFAISAGRFHTPIGYWNTAYHHGAIIQDTVTRPTFLNFEDGYGAIIPMHIIGAMGTGNISTGAGSFNYDLMVGNSTSVNADGAATTGGAGTPASATESTMDVNSTVDPSNKKVAALKVSYKLSAMPLEVGAFVFNNPIVQSGVGGGTIFGGATLGGYGSDLISQRVTGGHFRYATAKFDVLGESYNLSDDDKISNTGKHKASAYFVQFGYHLTENLKPIYRFEKVDYKNEDPYFQIMGTEKGSRHVFDLRYDLSDTNVLKLEIGRFETMNPGDVNVNGTGVNKSYNFYALQWAFMLL